MRWHLMPILESLAVQKRLTGVKLELENEGSNFPTCIAKICCNNEGGSGGDLTIACDALGQDVLLMRDNNAINRSGGLQPI